MPPLQEEEQGRARRFERWRWSTSDERERGGEWVWRV